MARKPTSASATAADQPGISGYDKLLLEAMERGDETLQTGRYIVTYREDAPEAGAGFLESMNLRVADARDFGDQAVSVEDVGDADALVFPEVGVAVIGSQAAAERELGVSALDDATASVEAVEPEYFAFADDAGDYLRGFRRAVEVLSADLGLGMGAPGLSRDEFESDVQALGATWGLVACRVPQSQRNGAPIRVAVLDTGMALTHPDFQGRQVIGQTFVGQPVMDLHSHGTHCIGTACGPKAPMGTTPRYGIAHQCKIFAGKVLSNSGSGGTAGIIAGINWAIANRCEVISMSLGAPTPPQAGYTAAGRAALARGCLIVAATGNIASQTGAPANSPTIMAVASLDPNLAPSAFSNFGKVEIAAPGRDVFSSVPMPQRYGIKTGTSMATPHVAGCAALWAHTNPNLRGQALWNKLQQTARTLPHPASRVGAGLAQAPV
jgi:subtilisin